MSDFTRGLLLGSGNLFGDDDPSADLAGRLKAENQSLVVQNRRLKAEVAQDDALLEALKTALHHENPNHPLVSPLEAGENPLRKKIGDAAWHKAYQEFK